jgi:hypothetical protein
MPKEFPEIKLKNDLLFGAITRSSGNAICSCHLLGVLAINNSDLKLDTFLIHYFVNGGFLHTLF